MSIRRLAVCLASSFLLGLAPGASAAPCAGFTDVQDTDQFCIHIEWLRNRAITLGCTTTQYCPAQYVRRDQMAAFLYRLGVQNAFLQGGNAFGTTAQLGTTDARSLQVLSVGGTRAPMLSPSSNGWYGSSPNLVGGHPLNEARVTCSGICVPTPAPVVGAVVAGGGTSIGIQLGKPGHRFVFPSQTGVVGGGRGNRAGNDNANDQDAEVATVAGGGFNAASADYASVGGGWSNVADGSSATIGGGSDNHASGSRATVSGARLQAAISRAAFLCSTVPGGSGNEAVGDFSFAAGRRAKTSCTGSASESLRQCVRDRDTLSMWQPGVLRNNFDFARTWWRAFRQSPAPGLHSYAGARRRGRCAGGGRAFVTDSSNRPVITRQRRRSNRGRVEHFVWHHRRLRTCRQRPSGVLIERCLVPGGINGRATQLRSPPRQVGPRLLCLGRCSTSTVATPTARTGTSPHVREHGRCRWAVWRSDRASTLARSHSARQRQDDRDGAAMTDGAVAQDFRGVRTRPQRSQSPTGWRSPRSGQIALEQAREIAELRRLVEMLVTRTSSDGRVVRPDSGSAAQ